MKLDLFLLANIIITIAYILQIVSIYGNNIFTMNPYSFLLISLGTFIMGYAQYQYSDNVKVNVPIKIINGILTFLIFISVYQVY